MVVYDGSHSITFWKNRGNIKRNTWKDFHLIPKSRPFISIPEPIISILKIPGTNKRFDITEYLSKSLTFKQQTGEWDFYIVHDLWENWSDAYNTISDFLHGERVILSLDDDPSVYYEGTLTISNYSVGNDYSSISIHYELNYNAVFNPAGFYPIKFILSDGTSYIQDYGLPIGIQYMENGIPVFYNLIQLKKDEG